MLSGLGLATFLANSLGPAQFGRYALSITTANVAGVLLTLGLGQLSLSELPKSEIDSTARGVLSRRFATVVVVAGLGSGVLLICSSAIGDPADGAMIALLSVLAAVVYFLSSATRSVGRVHLANATNGVMGGMISQSTTLVAMIALYASDVMSFDTLDDALSIHAVVLAALVCVLAFASGIAPRMAGWRRWLGADLRSGLPFALNQAIKVVPIDLWIGAVMLPPSQLGTYAVARRLANLIAVPLQIGNVATVRDISKYVHEDRARAQVIVTRTARYAALLAVVPLIAAVFFAPTVVEGLFGAAFSDASELLTILGLGVAVNIFSGPCGIVLAMAGYERRLAAFGVITAISIALLGTLGAELWGAVGLAAAVSVSTSLRFVVLARYSSRYANIFTLPTHRLSSVAKAA
jgi:O-antigen/teichoic acid export membrane protein